MIIRNLEELGRVLDAGEQVWILNPGEKAVEITLQNTFSSYYLVACIRRGEVCTGPVITFRPEGWIWVNEKVPWWARTKEMDAMAPLERVIENLAVEISRMKNDIAAVNMDVLSIKRMMVEANEKP
jgi:hypothetical protein